MAEPQDYVGREQMWVKHWMLQRYLEQLIFKVGQGRSNWRRFVYIDAYAGPWQSQTQDLSDTSFGSALRVMRSCQDRLDELGRQIPMHAVFFELNKLRAARLINYAEENSTPRLTINAYKGDFMDHIDAVAGQLRDDDFAFVLIDPTGYKDLVPERLAPLLRRRGVEVLINLMWDFINRFWDTDKAPVLDKLFGSNRRERCGSEQREHDASQLYGHRLREVAGYAGGRLYAATFPVQHPAKDRTHYFLIYATHAPVGLLTFDAVAEATWQEQALTKAKSAVRRQSDATPDLFGGAVHAVQYERPINGETLRNAWLKRFPVTGSEIVVTADVMAQLLEECGCLSNDLQVALKRLIEQGVIENASIDEVSLRRRKKNVVQIEKRERLRRLR